MGVRRAVHILLSRSNIAMIISETVPPPVISVAKCWDKLCWAFTTTTTTTITTTATTPSTPCINAITTFPNTVSPHLPCYWPCCCNQYTITKLLPGHHLFVIIFQIFFIFFSLLFFLFFVILSILLSFISSFLLSFSRGIMVYNVYTNSYNRSIDNSSILYCV